MVNNLWDLEKVIQSYIIQSLQLTGNTIYEKLKEKVDAYYNEPVFSESNTIIPDVYQRTNTLKDSLFEPVITQNGNAAILTTGFEDDYLSFEYPSGKKTNLPLVKMFWNTSIVVLMVVLLKVVMIFGMKPLKNLVANKELLIYSSEIVKRLDYQLNNRGL